MSLSPNLSIILSGGFLRNTDPAGKVRGQEGLLGLPHPGVQARDAAKACHQRINVPQLGGNPEPESVLRPFRAPLHPAEAPEPAPPAGAGRICLQLLDDKRLRPIQVILCQDLPVHGIAQQVRQGLHGEAVLVRHIDPGGLERCLCEGAGGLPRAEGQLRPAGLVPPDGEIFVEYTEGVRPGEAVAPQVPQRVLQTVGGELRGVIVRDGIAW